MKKMTISKLDAFILNMMDKRVGALTFRDQYVLRNAFKTLEEEGILIGVGISEERKDGNLKVEGSIIAKEKVEGKETNLSEFYLNLTKNSDYKGEGFINIKKVSLDGVLKRFSKVMNKHGFNIAVAKSSGFGEYVAIMLNGDPIPLKIAIVSCGKDMKTVRDENKENIKYM